MVAWFLRFVYLRRVATWRKQAVVRCLFRWLPSQRYSCANPGHRSQDDDLNYDIRQGFRPLGEKVRLVPEHRAANGSALRPPRRNGRQAWP
jgi:hypothetical protein